MCGSGMLSTVCLLDGSLHWKRFWWNFIVCLYIRSLSLVRIAVNTSVHYLLLPTLIAVLIEVFQSAIYCTYFLRPILIDSLCPWHFWSSSLKLDTQNSESLVEFRSDKYPACSVIRLTVKVLDNFLDLAVWFRVFGRIRNLTFGISTTHEHDVWHIPFENTFSNHSDLQAGITISTG